MYFEVTPAANVDLSTFRAALPSRNICSSKTASVLISVSLLAYSELTMRREWCWDKKTVLLHIVENIETIFAQAEQMWTVFFGWEGEAFMWRAQRCEDVNKWLTHNMGTVFML